MTHHLLTWEINKVLTLSPPRRSQGQTERKMSQIAPFVDSQTAQLPLDGAWVNRRHETHPHPQEKQDHQYSSILFLSIGDYKLLDSSDTVIGRLIGREKVRRFLGVLKKYYGIMFIMWLSCIILYIIQAFQAFCAENAGMLLLYLTGSAFPSFFLAYLPYQMVVDSLKTFNTVYLLCNLVANTVFLNFYYPAYQFLWGASFIYFFSYLYGFFVDISNIQFGVYEKWVKNKISSMNDNPGDRERRERWVELLKSGDMQIPLNGPELVRTYCLIQDTQFTKEFSNMEKKSHQGLISVTTANALYTSIFMGTSIQLLINLIIQSNYLGYDEKVLINIGWEIWTTRDLVLFTSINMFIFTFNRLFLIYTNPAKQSCYKRGMIRIPMIPGWRLLLDQFIETRKRLMEENGEGGGNTLTSTPLFSTLTLAEQNIGSSIDTQVAGFRQMFSDTPTLAPGQTFCRSRIIALIEGNRLGFDVMLSKSIVKHLVSYLKGRSRKIYRFLRMFVFICWVITYFLSFAIAFVADPLFVSIYRYMAVISFIDIAIFLFSIPLEIYIQSLKSFETVLMISNMFMAPIAMMDCFEWKGDRVKYGCPLLLLSLCRVIFYDMIQIPWASLEKNIHLIRVHDSFQTEMPFTFHLLRRLQYYYVEKGQMPPESLQYTIPLRNNTGECDADRDTTAMTIKERMLYHKILGFGGINYYTATIAICIALYIQFVAGFAYDVNVRTIEVFFIRWRNISVLKSSLLNIVIFGCKRLYQSIMNPMISTTITNTQLRVPLVPSFIYLYERSTHINNEAGDKGNEGASRRLSRSETAEYRTTQITEICTSPISSSLPQYEIKGEVIEIDMTQAEASCSFAKPEEATEIVSFN